MFLQKCFQMYLYVKMRTPNQFSLHSASKRNSWSLRAPQITHQTVMNARNAASDMFIQSESKYHKLPQFFSQLFVHTMSDLIRTTMQAYRMLVFVEKSQLTRHTHNEYHKRGGVEGFACMFTMIRANCRFCRVQSATCFHVKAKL